MKLSLGFKCLAACLLPIVLLFLFCPHFTVTYLVHCEMFVVCYVAYVAGWGMHWIVCKFDPED